MRRRSGHPRQPRRRTGRAVRRPPRAAGRRAAFHPAGARGRCGGHRRLAGLRNRRAVDGRVSRPAGAEGHARCARRRRARVAGPRHDARRHHRHERENDDLDAHRADVRRRRLVPGPHRHGGPPCRRRGRAGPPHHARGARPAGALRPDARSRRASRGDGGEFDRPDRASRRRPGVRRGGVSQSDARPPRLPRDLRRLRRGESAALPRPPRVRGGRGGLRRRPGRGGDDRRRPAGAHRLAGVGAAGANGRRGGVHDALVRTLRHPRSAANAPRADRPRDAPRRRVQRDQRGGGRRLRAGGGAARRRHRRGPAHGAHSGATRAGAGPPPGRRPSWSTTPTPPMRSAAPSTPFAPSPPAACWSCSAAAGIATGRSAP